ncbi:diguanylate cyclase [Pluralibacter gergoviae]|uniref:diguanylate cyclase n=1 Tax=Pluralibacter gergoviae TaxID=61647 RepID=UPI00069DEEB9
MKISHQRTRVMLYHPLRRTASLSVLTFIFTLFSLELTHAGASLAPLWFPTSLMTVACYRHPLKMWPYILICCPLSILLACQLVSSVDATTFPSLAINIIEAIIGALLMRKLLPNYNPLQNLQDWGRLAFSCALVPPLVGGALVLMLAPGDEPLQTLIVWMQSEAIGALALVPLGMLYKNHYLLRHRNPQLLLETVATLIVTLTLSAVAILWMPWPFTCIIVLLMWSAVRLPRMEAFTVFLLTTMMVSLLLAAHPQILSSPRTLGLSNIAWLPFLMMLLPVNIMTMVMYAFRLERKHISESELRFRNAMEYSAIGMALVSVEGQWLQVNKALCQFLGYEQSELLATTFQQITWPEDLDKDLRQLDKLLRGEVNSYSMEKRYVTRSGKMVWALLAVSLVRAPDGAPLYLIAQIEDIDDLKQSEEVNRRLMERITLANEAGGIGIWEWLPAQQAMVWDKRMHELYELPQDVSLTREMWLDCLLDEDRYRIQELIRSTMAMRASFMVEFRIRVKSGIRHIRSHSSVVLNAEGEVERLIGINMDMTEVKQLNEALFQEKERLHITLDSIADAVICTDVAMNVIFMNPVAEKMCGWRQDEALDRPLGRVLHITAGGASPIAVTAEGACEMAIDQDVVLHSRSGGRYDIHYSVRPLSTLEGKSLGLVLVIHDVTESRKLLRELSYSASHDPLTQLANRSSFEHQLSELLESLPQSRQSHALAFIDLDRFKAVNDSAGHAAGDALLQALATLMQQMLRPGDVLARLGGDEFGLLLPDRSLASARMLCGRIVQAIAEYPFSYGGQEHRVGASIGITRIDATNARMSEVMSQADIACYAAKNSGRGTVSVYAPSHPNRAATDA